MAMDGILTTKHHPLCATSLMKRRDFLKQSVITSALAFHDWKPAQALVAGILPRRGPAKRILVVGAGLAGLSAAYELMQAGHDVVVLEAQGRSGGRVLTLREPFADGLYAEAGAMNVFDNHFWTLKYIKLFNLTLDSLSPSNLGSVVLIKGKRILTKPGQPVAYPLDLSAEEQKFSRRELWDKYVGPAIKELGDYTASDWPPPSLKKYDDITFYDFLRKQGASADAASLLGLGAYGGLGDGVNSVSALVLLREAAHRAGMHSNATIRGGTDTLPKAFAARLTDKIRYGAPVVSLKQDKKGVRVVYIQAGVQTSIEADFAICAVPFSVLKQINVEPHFSPEKQRAINELPYTSVARTFMQTRKHFWIDENLSGSATTDVGNTMVFEGAPNQGTTSIGARGILESYMSGPIAREVTAMPTKQRIDWVLKIVEKAYPQMRENFEVGTIKCWDEDEWARGGYAWYKPGQMTSLLPYVAKPEGRIHFAGEHASSLFGWMQGALESGNRVAQEINSISD